MAKLIPARWGVRQSLGSEPPLVVAVVTILTGVGAGLCGAVLLLLLRFVQHLAYGYEIGKLRTPVSFLQGVMAASPGRRVAALSVCGLLAGTGWWAVHRFARPLTSIARVLEADDPQMPIKATTADSLLQVVTVALGSPLGREVAPRQIAATLAGWLSKRAGLPLETSRLMVACGAGAGLAAVYNVPFGGGVFTLEVLLRTFRFSAVLPAVVTSVTAATVAWIGLGDEVTYTVPHLASGPSLIVWAIVVGPLLGVAGYGFSRLTTVAVASSPHDGRVFAWCPPTFLGIGLLAIPFPQLLGNGKGLTQLGFTNELTIGLAAVLMVLRVCVTTAAFRAGARGGTLTPSLALGALLATVLGGLWRLWRPDTPLGAFAVVGSAAFLAAVQRAPVTATVLVLEFTRVDYDFMFPILFAVGGSAAVAMAWGSRSEHQGSGVPLSAHD